MKLRLHVSDAAYEDKAKSDLISFELVPHTELGSTSGTPRAFLNVPVVRTSEQLEALHGHLLRKYPNSLLPRLPDFARSSSDEWGTEAFVHKVRQRVQRYFDFLLARSEMQSDSLIIEFLSPTLDYERFGGPQTAYFEWLRFPFFKPEVGSVHRLETYVPRHEIPGYNAPHMMREQQRLKRREAALEEAIYALNDSLGILQQTAEALRHAGERFEDVASVCTGEPTARAKLRETGARFAQTTLHIARERNDEVRDAAKSLGLALLEQKHDLANLIAYESKVVDAARHLDKAIGARCDAEGRVVRVGEGVDNEREMASAQARLEHAQIEEEHLKSVFATRLEAYKEDMCLYWHFAMGELASAAISDAVADSRHHQRILSELQRWND